MTEHLKTTLLCVTTSGIKIIGILVAFFILSQMSRWIVTWTERFVFEKDPLQAVEAKKRAQTLENEKGSILFIIFTTYSSHYTRESFETRSARREKFFMENQEMPILRKILQLSAKN